MLSARLDLRGCSQSQLRVRDVSCRPELLVCNSVRSREFTALTGFLQGGKSSQLTLSMKTKRISKKLTLEAEAPAVALPPRFLKEMRYSNRAIKARAKVVQLVMDSLSLQGALKSGADVVGTISNPVLELVIEKGDAADVCGSLMILLELKGEDRQVIAAGSAFLEDKPTTKGFHSSVIIRDIALSVAVAHRNLAASYLGHPDMGLEEAFGHASEGLLMMQTLEPKYGAVLRSDLHEILLSLAVPYTSSLLSTPASRKKGVQVMKDVLRLLVSAPTQRAELFSRIGRELSAAEQIAVYESFADVVSIKVLSDQELYDLALASIADGYTTRWPQHIFRADTLLAEISNRSGNTLDVVLERSVCALLLGKVEEATAQLVTAPDSVPGLYRPAPKVPSPSPRPSEQLANGTNGMPFAGTAAAAATASGASIEISDGAAAQQLGSQDSAFVVLQLVDGDKKGSGDDSSRIALESWAEGWIELSCLSNFKDVKQSQGKGKEGAAEKVLPGGRHVSLKSYLSSPTVVVFNQLLHQAGQSGQLQQVTSTFGQASQEAMEKLLGVFKGPASASEAAQKEAADSSSKVGGKDTAGSSSSSSGSSNETSAAAAVRVGLEDVLTAPLVPDSDEVSPDDDEAALTQAGDGGSGGSMDALRSFDASNQLWVEDKGGKIKPRTLARVVDASGTDRGIQLERQAWLNAVKEVMVSNARVTVATAFFVVAFLYTRPALQAAVQMTVPLPTIGTATTRVSLPNSLEAAMEIVSAAQRNAAAALDPAAADQLLVAYLAVRSTVMRSPSLADRLLPRLLEGPALAAARQQAQDLALSGRHLDLTSSSVDLRSVEVVHGKDAKLTASVKEAGSFLADQPALPSTGGTGGTGGSTGSKARYKSKRELDVVLKYDVNYQVWKVYAVSDAGVI